jgi:ABC-2 type transport system permease protein
VTEHSLPSTGFAATPRARPVERANWYGLWTLFHKELRRVLKMPGYTVFAPIVTAVLYLAVFTIAFGGDVRGAGGTALADFMAPGLVMMAIVNAAFINTSASVLEGKMNGTIADLLMPPLSPLEVVLGVVGGGAFTGCLVGLGLVVVMQPFVPLFPAQPVVALLLVVAASSALAMLGLITGMWARTWDHLAAVMSFTVMPLAFLSGAFYSIERLPAAWRMASQFNPIFYMVDGFRYSFIGVADGSLALGVGVLVVLNLGLGLVCYRLVANGYNLRH